ncbi:3-hydroxyacyl-CoA dehydrogenase family protein [Levilactobacillus zymae]|uniref:3-hydroxyacyl-CoA dehydrogenase family protein n=1 Tax=Levilactobacillus zymae TaxID=267363 RepID=UPI0028BA6057|nr:3-hydroxyacyl-CoA dehydrogenase family protein [Levilactobacillus zymae]MDT6979614.1 3-hydroxyacyl-CoA dehydrogenase family protein [Levilactobacillus zymae]
MDLSKFKVIGNIGAGTMGHATALQFAMHGYTVNLLDTSDDALNNGMAGIKHDLETFEQAGILSDTPQTILSRIHPTTNYQEALTAADFVIESVVEKLDVKRLVWQEAEKYVSDQTILATNTSGLSPTAIQQTLTHPERFVVAHFWNPAQLMPLVEVVPGEQTDAATVTTTVALMTHIGKHAVPLQKEALGFVGNRIQLAVLREALHIIDDGIATPEAVDDIIKYSLGRRWSLVGPVASADLGGLDVFNNISAYLYADLANDTGTDPALAKKVAAHQLGLKTGQGFYNWTGTAGQEVVAQRDRDLLNLLKADQSH